MRGTLSSNGTVVMNILIEIIQAIIASKTQF